MNSPAAFRRTPTGTLPKVSPPRTPPSSPPARQGAACHSSGGALKTPAAADTAHMGSMAATHTAKAFRPSSSRVRTGSSTVPPPPPNRPFTSPAAAPATRCRFSCFISHAPFPPAGTYVTAAGPFISRPCRRFRLSP